MRSTTIPMRSPTPRPRPCSCRCRLPSPPRTSASRRRCAFIDGFSLHADTSVDAADRPGLERLVRYLLRPLISADHLTVRSDGRVEYHFRRPDPSGRTSWVTDGTTWCRRLATFIPPRRAHTTRFHGVLASAHGWRARIVPTPPTAAEVSAQSATTTTPPPTMMLARRLDWAALLRRVFGDQVTQCPRCGDHLRVLAFITDPGVTAHIRPPRPRFRRRRDRTRTRAARRRAPRSRLRLLNPH